MSIVKDLLLLLFLILFIIKYFDLLKRFRQQKEYFLNVLNHDLKISVLAQIRGLNLLKNKSLSDTQKDFLVENIVESGEYSLDMIGMLLNTYKFESGENVINYEKFNISDLLRKCSVKLKRLCLEKDLSFVYQIDSSLQLEADKCFMEKASSILLSTAISNSNKDSSLYVFAKKSRNDVVVSIVYNGKPLTEEEEARMFDKSSRFSAVGHGIKMNLCKKIIDFHNGYIFVKKMNKNLNSFTFVIPALRKNKTSRSINISALQEDKV